MLITLKLLNIKNTFKQQIIRGFKAISDFMNIFDLELNFQSQISQNSKFCEFTNAYNSLTIGDRDSLHEANS